MQGTNNSIYNRQKPYGTSGHAYGISGLSMQTVQDMAGVSGSYMNMDSFSTKDYSDTIVFDTKKSFFNNLRLRKYRKRYAGLFGFIIFVCFVMGLYWILFSANKSKSNNVSIFEDDNLKITHDDINHDILHSNDKDLHTGDWSDLEEDWIDEHDFLEEDIDDIEDIEHGRSHYAKVVADLDNNVDNSSHNTLSDNSKPIKTTADLENKPISTENNDYKLPMEIQGSIPPKPLTEIPVHDESVVYFPRTIHLLGRVGAHSAINGKYTVMMHPYHEESPWIHGGRLIWYKTGKTTANNYYIFYEKKLHNWVLTDKFDLANPNPIAFLPDHGVMPVKGVGKHGCKAQHYWYFREKQDDQSYKLVMDRSVLVTDNGILLNSLPDHQQNSVFSGSSSNHDVIGLKLHKNQVHVDHKYYSDKYSSSYPNHHNIADPYINL